MTRNCQKEKKKCQDKFKTNNITNYCYFFKKEALKQSRPSKGTFK